MVENLSRDRRKNSHRLFCAFVCRDLEQALGKVPEVTEVVKYLLRFNIVRQSIINRYVVIKLYPEYLERYEKKDRAVNAMAKVLPLEATAIYNILSNHYAYFHPNRIEF
jgi:ABC-type transport system involved in Fe-S cluster assembly fused permease/ATPase subunit